MITQKSPWLIDTWSDADAACASLRKHTLLALDMEGSPLATRTELLQLAVSSAEIYVFDVRALGQRLFADDAYLQPILANPSIIKLCYDCRADGGALLRQHGVCARGLYDLQIAYASLRAHAPKQLGLPLPHRVERFLKGLQCAVGHLLAPDDALAFRQRKQAWKLEWSTQHMQNLAHRPLPEGVLEYAAADVEHLFAMYERWSPFFAASVVKHASETRMLSQLMIVSEEEDMARIDFPLLLPRQLLFHHNNIHGGPQTII